MTAGLLIALALAIMTAALFLTPLGLPGNWIMVGVLALAAITGHVGVAVLVAVTVLALVAELVEFLIVQRMNVRWGGSKNAFWGAIAGGILGIFVGAPIPVIGSLVAGAVGSFVGAAAVTVLEGRQAGAALRVGWGVLLGRAFSAAAKTAAGVMILVLGGFALVMR